MSSIKEKLKSKIKSKIDLPQTMESFDETSLSLTLFQPKTQLCQIRVQCQWNNKNGMKIPKLKCLWYNRTENNLQLIEGVEDEVYQPSLLDVGSIIQISCVPELPGISYEGMPIQLKSIPIALAPQTQLQASTLLTQGRAKFFIELKEAKLRGKAMSHGCESLLKIQGYKLVICQMKFGQLNDDILKQLTINQLYPHFTPNRRICRQLTIKLSQEDYCVVNFKNHQVRDIFCLFNKLLVAKICSSKLQKSLESSSINSQSQTSNSNNNEKQQLKTSLLQGVGKHSTADLLQLSNLKQQIKQLQAANMKLNRQLQEEKQRNLVLENKVSQTNERLQSASRNYFELEETMNRYKSDLLRLQKEADQKVHVQSTREEEILYYKNEIKILMGEKVRLAQIVGQITIKNEQYQNQINKYHGVFSSNGQNRPFSELVEQLKSMRQMNRELKLKYEFSQEEKDKIEENLRNSRNQIQQIEAQKNYIYKKYQSLSNELTSPLSISKVSETKSGGESSLSNSYVMDVMPVLDRRQSLGSVVSYEMDGKEREVGELRKQVKQLSQQNAYIRSLLVKQKKSSSKTQLKLQLFEAKKIVSKQVQTLMEKDMAIANLKEINRQLNKKNSELQMNTSNRKSV